MRDLAQLDGEHSSGLEEVMGKSESLYKEMFPFCCMVFTCDFKCLIKTYL